MILVNTKHIVTDIAEYIGHDTIIVKLFRVLQSKKRSRVNDSNKTVNP